MTIETWLLFLAATAFLLVIPGPTVLLVVSYALGQGWHVALPIAIGVALGDFTAMTLSMAGVGALLATSAQLFTALKWLGAAYLIWLGVKLWRVGGNASAAPRAGGVSALGMLGHAWIVTALNPKSITFFVAFLPQFLDAKADVLAQMVICEATFLALAFGNALLYALIAARARHLVANPRALDLQQGRRHASHRRRYCDGGGARGEPMTRAQKEVPMRRGAPAAQRARGAPCARSAAMKWRAIASPVGSQTSPKPRARAIKSRKMPRRIGRPVTWGCSTMVTSPPHSRV
jgi:threonine/homoserine/homoserine lactone efflux protein